MLPSFYHYYQELINFLFPELCVLCNRTLVKQEDEICVHCFNELPLTYYHFDDENPVSKLFWSRPNVLFGTALYHYGKGNKIQKYLHALKYENRPYLGVKAGKIYGNMLKENRFISDCDYIIPVPLHPLKLKVRGYNQSEVLGNGLSESLGIPQVIDVLIRTINTSSQTKKSKEERAENVKNVFQINRPEKIQNKTVLLIDDVVTTGSTLDACCETLSKIEGVKIVILCIAAR